jgi:glycosyltransferase involved in cell wall biosynthesis
LYFGVELSNTKIAIITPASFPGTAGDTVNYIEIMKQLIAEGHRITLICPSNDVEIDKVSQCNPNYLQMKRIPFIPPRLVELRNGVSRRHYLRLLLFLASESLSLFWILARSDIRYAYMRHGFLTLQVPLILKLLRITTVADGELFTDSLHVLRLPNVFLKILKIYEHRIMKLYSRYKVSTRSHAERLIMAGYPKERIIEIPMSINIEEVPRFSIEQIPKHTFGYFGALEPWQGADILIRSFQSLLKKIPTATLYIIGEGSMKNSLKQLISRNSLNSNITLVDAVPRETIWAKYFPKFRVVVIPRPKMNNSIDFLPSIKLVEALASGKAVIATDIPAMREIPNEAVKLVAPDDIDSLSQAMESLTNDEVELYNYSSKALAAASNYDIRVNLKKLIQALTD